MNLNFDSSIILENRKALLMPLSLNYSEELTPIALEKDLWKISSSTINSKKDLLDYLEQALKERANNLSYPFIIIDKIKNKVAGSTRYGNINKRHNRLEIGWTWIGKEFQKTSLNTSCKYLLLQYAFEKLNVKRVELKTDILNENSRRAMIRIGANQEGILRNHMIVEGGRVRNSTYLSILSSEWNEVKNRFINELIYG